MSKTTPEAAAALAEKHGATAMEVWNRPTGNSGFLLTATELAALIDEVRALEREECAKAVENQPFMRGDGRVAGVTTSAEIIRARAAAEVGKEVGG